MQVQEGHTRGETIGVKIPIDRYHLLRVGSEAAGETPDPGLDGLTIVPSDQSWVRGVGRISAEYRRGQSLAVERTLPVVGCAEVMNVECIALLMNF